jgi:hypothetical protein
MKEPAAKGPLDVHESILELIILSDFSKLSPSLRCTFDKLEQEVTSWF